MKKNKKKPLSDKYFYWNKIPSMIPDLGTLYVSGEEEWIKKWEDSVWTKNVKTRHQILRNIKDIPVINKIPIDIWMMDRLKETCDLYTRGFFIASISLCGILTEFITLKMIEEWIKEKDSEKIIEYSRSLGHQKGRIDILKKLKKITPEESKLLHKIRDTRNKYVHSNIIERRGTQTKSDNKIVLEKLIEFLNSRF